MGEGTRFDPDILEEAYKALVDVKRTIDEDSRGLGSMDQASTVESEITLSDTKGGWRYLKDEVSGVATAVRTYVAALESCSAQVNEAMRGSIDILQGADDQNEHNANQQNQSTGVEV